VFFSEILDMRTLKQVNMKWHFFIKHTTTSIILTLKIRQWKCTVSG